MAVCRIEWPVLVSTIMKLLFLYMTGNVLASLYGIRCGLKLHSLHNYWLTFRHRASCILGQAFHYSPENVFYIFNQQINFISDICLTVHH